MPTFSGSSAASPKSVAATSRSVWSAPDSPGRKAVATPQASRPAVTPETAPAATSLEAGWRAGSVSRQRAGSPRSKLTASSYRQTCGCGSERPVEPFPGRAAALGEVGRAAALAPEQGHRLPEDVAEMGAGAAGP